MSDVAEAIAESLAQVALERLRRRAQPLLFERVHAVKVFQQDRFAATYADLLSLPRYALAARFFLDELYGPQDFEARDAQFARVVPALVRLFPSDVVQTVRALVELHQLSESFDTAMAEALGEQDLPLTAFAYVRAWQRTGRQSERAQQIKLTIELGTDLDRLTTKRVLRNTLKLMRRPARAAGMSELQSLLETGFDAFRAMDGAGAFLDTVFQRETALMTALFAAPEGLSDEQAESLLI
jgi:hypothetical protein